LNYLTCSEHIQSHFLFRWNITSKKQWGMELLLFSLQGLPKSIRLWRKNSSRKPKNNMTATLLPFHLGTCNTSSLLELFNENNGHWQSEKVEWSNKPVHYITFPGSIVSQNDCRMWNKSYKYKNTYTVQLKHSKSTSIHM
jgi:hypothetical protein